VPPTPGARLGSGTCSAALTAVAPRSALAPTAAPAKRSRRVAAFIMFLRFDWSLGVNDHFELKVPDSRESFHRDTLPAIPVDVTLS
jgi:hypothetical protein